MSRREEDGGLPHDRAAEELVLAGMMASRDEADAAAAVLAGPGDFYVPAHQVIYEAVAGLAGRDEPSGPVAVADALAAAGQLGKAGGSGYLETLPACPAGEAGFYARIVRDRAAERQMIAAGAGIVRAGRARGLDLAGKVDEAYRVLDEAGGLTAPAGARLIAELLPGALDRIENGPDLAGVPTGWGDLDELAGGWRPGLHIVAARPSVGKSTILLNTAAHAAAAGVPVVVFSLEMPERECTGRILSAEALVSGTRLRDGTLDDGDWERLTEARERIAGWPLRISDDPYLGVAGIRAELRSLRRAGEPAGMAVVDYVQMMTGGGRAESRQEEVSGISRGLKLLSKEFDVPVIVGAQLNRGPEMRSDHRPLLADLRNSGSLEQDADMVILLHREDAYERESPRAGEMDLIVAKHRGGPCATVTVAFQGWYSRAADMSGSWSPAAAARGRPDPAAAWDAAAQERRDELAAKRAERGQGSP